MKILYLCLSLVLPLATFGQLFPTIPGFKGHIEQVVEKKYGKEANFLKLSKKSYHPGIYSGWKYIYQFNEHSKLIRRTNSFNGKIRTEYIYQHDSIENKRIEREITSEKSSENKGDYIEYENFIDPEGHIEKVHFWAFNSKECSRQIFQVEKNVEYKKDKLIAFTRQNIDANGDTASAETCRFFYDSSGKVSRIERKDIESGFATILKYDYNNQGLVDHYSIDYLVGLNEYGKKNLAQEVYFKYDRQGNWIKMYWKSDKKKGLEAKRKIKYW